MSEVFKLRIESEADLTGLNAYLGELPKLDDSQGTVDKGLQQLGKDAKATELTFGQLERELQQARLALSMLTPSDARLPQLQQHIAGIGLELNKAGGGMRGFRGDVGQAALMMAQFTDDAQYGVRGILNNIPSLVMAFGGTAGVAGVLSIAAVAASQLWEKFGGAADAKDDADQVKEAVKGMHAALERAATASEEVFKADIKAYLADVDKATKSWEQQCTQLEKALSYQNEIAKVQMQIANHQLEIARQNELGAAGSEDERKAVNARFDAQKAELNSAGEMEQAKRNLTASQAEEAMLRGQFSSRSRDQGEAMGSQFQNNRARAQFATEYGSVSDQGQRVAAAEQANAAFMAAQEAMRAAQKALAENRVGEAAPALQAVAQRREEEFNAAKVARNTANVGIGADRAALARGDLDFSRSMESSDPAVAQRAAQGASKQAQLNAERDKIAEELKQHETALAKIRQREADNAKKQELQRLQAQAAELADSALFAKGGTNKIVADQQAAEALKQKQIKEQEALAKQKEQAQEVGGKGAGLGAEMGAAGAGLQAAAAALKDGATESELTALLAELKKFGPDVIEVVKGQGKKVSDLTKEVSTLRSQLRNMQL